MDDVWLLSTLITTALAVCLWLAGPLRKFAPWMNILVPIPPLIWALTSSGGMVDVPWLLMGVRLGIDTLSRVFLGVTGALWLAAAVYARSYMQNDGNELRFNLFFFLTMVGNIGLTVAHDVASFLFFYTLMSVAAYGLIVHDGRRKSLEAGRVYIALTILGEMILFVVVTFAFYDAQSLLFEELQQGIAGSPNREVISLAILCGFGIKLGIMPLHFWLPLAHPAAPTPASAVLSGAMIKTGLLGILRILPFGIVTLETVPAVMISAGIATAFLAAAFGVMQSNAKTVLAYSSISQMGLIAIGAGVGLFVPSAWKIVSAMLMLFVVHHAVAKAALFLGVGVAGATKGGGWKRFGVIAGLVWSALTLSGMPLTTGLAAKTALKYSVAESPDPWATVVAVLLPFSSLATTLLMFRYLWLVWPPLDKEHHYPKPGMVIPWALLAGGTTANWILCVWLGVVKTSWLSLNASTITGALWPILVAGLLFTIANYLVGKSRTLSFIRIPAGDVVIPMLATVSVLQTALRDAIAAVTFERLDALAKRLGVQSKRTTENVISGFGRFIEGDSVAGPLICLLAISIFLIVIN